MTDFAWLIEAPGQRYLGTQEIGHYPDFFWTEHATRATRFMSRWQADGVMMALRRMRPDLFAFMATLGEARAVEHGWLADEPPFDIETARECPKCGLEAKALLHRFCTATVCPVRDALKARTPPDAGISGGRG